MFSGPETCRGSVGLERRTERQTAYITSGQTLSIRAGAGLGDAIYLQSIARHFVEQGYIPEICCDWPEVFRALAGRVKLSRFRRERIDRLAHYSMRRMIAGTDQFQDCCIQAGIMTPVDLRLHWPLVNRDLARQISDKRPILVVPMPRAPFDRKDGFGAEFLPDCRRIQHAIDAVRGRAKIVQIGAGKPIFAFSGIDLDLANKTSVTDVIDIGLLADGFLGFCSFIVPLSESFKKRSLLIWSRRGLHSPHPVVRSMKPKKILHRASSHHIVDDCAPNILTEAIDALCDEIGGRAKI